MRTHHHPEDSAERERARRRSDAAAAPGDAVLALQRSAGNHAVAGLLARDKTDAAPEDSATSVTSQLGDLGVIPLDFANWDSNGKDVHIAFADGPITTQFMEAFTKGHALAPAWVSSPVAKSTLTGALIGSAQITGPSGGRRNGLVQATINFEKVDHDFVKR